MSDEFDTVEEADEINRNYTAEISGNVTTPDIQVVVKVFVLDIPFMLICAIVFTVYACLWDRLKVHGWLVMATSASFFIRSLTIATRDLAIHLAGWDITVEAPEFCVFLGKTQTG